MKNYFCLAMISIVIIASSCNKENLNTSVYTATVNVINAITSPNGADSEIKMNFTSGKINYADARSLGYLNFDGKFSNGALTFGVPTGKVPFNIVLSKDTIKPIYSNSLNFQSGDIYSLFITGEVDNPSTLLVKETIQSYKDSISGVRFINLSPNASSVSINISGSPLGSESTSLQYKGVTTFKQYSAEFKNSYYVFEIHDATTGEFLTGYYYDNIARFQNVTLIIRGVVGGNPGIEVVRFDNF